MKQTVKQASLLAATCLLAAAASAVKPPDFSGKWEFNPKKGENVGMMAGMKMTETIQQTQSTFDISTHANFQGQESDTKTHFDLGGKATPNESPMAGPSETVSKWEGASLVTTWTSQGAVAGSKTTRTETRSLSADGKEMTLESVRASRPPVVMVFDKKE
jgi:hypothetical protein